MINGGPDVNADDGRAGGVGDGGLGPDGALEEGEEDARDGLDGAEGEGVAASVHSGSKRESAGLALGDVSWAEEVGGSGQKLVSIVVAAKV